MNIFKSTSQNQPNCYSNILPLERGKKVFLAISLAVLSCLASSSAWASNSIDAKAAASKIHLAGLSINIGPGGFHIGIGVPSYGRAYGRSYYRSAPRHSWKHSKHHHGRQHHYDSPKRFSRGYGWKKDRNRSNFRGKSRGGRGGHRGGRW